MCEMNSRNQATTNSISIVDKLIMKNRQKVSTSSSKSLEKCNSYEYEEEEDIEKPLPVGFVPGQMDAICARGKSAYKHPGNCQYRKIIRSNLPQYSAAKTKFDKTLLVSSTLNQIREASSSGVSFVKLMEDGRWYEVGEHTAREKVGQR